MIVHRNLLEGATVDEKDTRGGELHIGGGGCWCWCGDLPFARMLDRIKDPDLVTMGTTDDREIFTKAERWTDKIKKILIFDANLPICFFCLPLI